jgi:ATP synthase protein I
MSDKPKKILRNNPTFAGEIGAQAARKLKARKSTQSTWFGFRMFGLVGWSVVVPTLIGAAFGHWLDQRYPGKHSWTLTLLIIGLCLGCLNAWHWVAREDKAIRDESEDKDE